MMSNRQILSYCLTLLWDLYLQLYKNKVFGFDVFVVHCSYSIRTWSIISSNFLYKVAVVASNVRKCCDHKAEISYITGLDMFLMY